MQVTTYAGSGISGSANGPNLTASFSDPYSLAIDAMGNVYVGDAGNDSIRIINPIWGVSNFGQINQGIAAGFQPAGLAVDVAGNVYCTDIGDYQGLKISPLGVATVLVGSGNAGSADGTGTAASFISPYGIALDALGNLYVADAYGNTIRKITPSGVVTTLAGNLHVGSADGTGTAATFALPIGVAADAAGNIYVADEDNNCIREISTSGIVTTIAGNTHIRGYKDGNGAEALFDAPSGIATDGGGTLYVADSHNNVIREIDLHGQVTTLAGTGYAGYSNGKPNAYTY